MVRTHAASTIAAVAAVAIRSCTTAADAVAGICFINSAQLVDPDPAAVVVHVQMYPKWLQGASILVPVGAERARHCHARRRIA